MGRTCKRDLVLFDGDAVTRRRLTLNMTRDELVMGSGCSPRTVWAVHNGVPISLMKAREIAKALRVSLRSLCAPKNPNKQSGEVGAQTTEHGPATAGAA